MNKLKPSQILFFSFILIIFIGTILLLLPISQGSEGNLSFFEALFTATSSLSVTGLSVVDISRAYSKFGQTIILVLIQLGGLGVMTFSSVFMLLIGRRIKYHEKKILMENLNRDSLDNIVDFIVKLIKIVFLIEFIGAIFLLIRFKQDMALLDAIFYSIFHSISAFCNAGISIFPDNLLSYSDSIIINFTISSLIIIGGIGFAVIYSFIDKIKDRKKESTLTTKVAVRITIWLLVIGFFVIIITEYNNPETIGTMSFFDKIMASFFQSATVRTAGFYTISVDKLMPGTRYLFYLFMFIGASPGSTGGGVKTTTFGVIIYSIIAIIRNKKDVTIINRRIS
ncbi:MAG: potassium transporter KtrB, partial [Fusobacteria bacterium]|nr:potassium transporter KtrB [Fusobacteriota bacterium]